MKTDTQHRFTHHHHPWKFMAINFGWTWLCWIPAAIISHYGYTAVATVLHLLGFGPTLAALILVYRTEDPGFIRDYWRRIIDIKRLGGFWLAVTLLLMPLLTVIPALIDRWFGGPGLQPELAEQFLNQPLWILPLTLFLLFFGPIPEEMGWRGYALDGLLNRHSALSASLIIGAFWACWHLPLFFIEGTYHYQLGIGTTAFWIFMLEPVFGSIFYTWIYNNTGRSTLSAVLLHFMGNYTGELFQLSQRAEILQFALGLALAVVVVLIYGPDKLKRSEKRSVK